MLNASNIFTLLKSAEELLKSNNMSEPKTDAEVLLCYVLKIKRSRLFFNRELAVSVQQFNTYSRYISKRITGQPVAYILGKTEFMGLDFIVNENVLIPRQETELLTEEVINQIKINKYEKVLDMCTGSGCIAISVAKDSAVEITASDISDKAIKVAVENAVINNVADKINFIISDMFSNISEQKFDIIISNPPYVKEEEFEKLEKELQFEPKQALVAREEGLFFYKQIAEKSKNYLNQKGLIIVELNANIPDKITGIFTNKGYKKIKLIKDYAGLDRVLVLKNG
ncbi:MAG: peptide chain release factor N(5)-glutamine methyltransferase [Endomicrobiaceae bacterium]|nr:peptide chain release factor N(5)-glutamine methyltransferase [Endomicrobiaceae bacterium]